MALVAADVPGESASWLLQLTREGDRYAVTRATEYTDPGYLVYSDVLPVQTAGGRRYLVSARVQSLLGPQDRTLTIADGLSAPVDVPSCTAVGVTATLRTTESLPRGRAADRLLDLGTGTVDPRYPLVRDESGTGRRALTGLDTCVLSGDRGPFGSIPRRIGTGTPPRSVPTSWPMAKLTVARSAKSPSAAASRPSCIGASRLVVVAWQVQVIGHLAPERAAEEPLLFEPPTDRADILRERVHPARGGRRRGRRGSGSGWASAKAGGVPVAPRGIGVPKALAARRPLAGGYGAWAQPGLGGRRIERQDEQRGDGEPRRNQRPVQPVLGAGEADAPADARPQQQQPGHL